MGRPISKRYFGTIDTSAKSATNPTADGKDQAGHTLTDTNLYSEKKLGYNIPVYTARVANAGTTYTEVAGGADTYPYIVKQTGSRSYLVRTSATAAHIGRCKLVNKAAGDLEAGEMVLQGFVGGDSGNNPTNIARLTKFYATDFSGNRYKWHVAPGVGSDSTLANLIVLTAATTASVN